MASQHKLLFSVEIVDTRAVLVNQIVSQFGGIVKMVRETGHGFETISGSIERIFSMSDLTHNAFAVAASLIIATGASAAEPCMSDKSDKEIAVGQLSIGRAQDAAGRAERPYILTLRTPACLTTDDPEDNVDKTRTIHIFSSQDTIARQIARFVGKSVSVRGRPFPAHTAHHHAPIVMDISAIEMR